MPSNETYTDSAEAISRLLQDRNGDIPSSYVNEIIYNVPSPNLQLIKTNASATLDQFIEMVNRIATKVLKKHGIIFSPDEGSKTKVSSTETLDQTHIQYKIKSRKPRYNTLKPVPLENFTESTPDGQAVRNGMVYTQKFDCIVQFDILASDYVRANEVMNAFEDAMFNYTAYFKKNGVSEVLFLEQFTDSDLDVYRNHVSVRSLQYKIVIERNRIQYSVPQNTLSMGGIGN